MLFSWFALIKRIALFNAPFTGAFLRLKVPMPDQIHLDSEPSPVQNAFSSDYVRQIKPFRDNARHPVLLAVSPQYTNHTTTIASPDLGKRARLLKANI